MKAKSEDPLRWVRMALYAFGVGLLTVGATRMPLAFSDTPVEGSQGTDTSLQATDSAVTVSAGTALGSSSPFAGLSITVNQTKNLSNQAISITWKGGTPTDSDLANKGRFDDNYLQIFECWGSPDNTNPNDPGPSPTACEFGANQLNGSVAGLSDAGSATISRQVSTGDKSPNAYVDPQGSGTFIPFVPVDGTGAVDLPTTPSTNPNEPEAQWANSYFDFTTTNELDYARTYPDGTGQELFPVDTGLEAPGLGCGEQVTQPDGSILSPRCWLVIVPRGTPADENGSSTTVKFVDTSPISGSAWSNRIAVPLSFDPIGTSCPLGSNERRIVGSELAAPAITNWEPTLCAAPGSPPYQYSPLSDDQARQELLTGGSAGGPGMAVESQPIDPSTLPSGTTVTYAPLTLSGIVIGFNIDRMLNINANDPTEAALAGERVTHIYLTPRLVAKLLTESYVNQFYDLNPANAPSSYQWLAKNPISLLDDPDFLQFNPEFQLLSCEGIVDCGGLVVEQPTSDAAYFLWQWILSDPEAKSWLDGNADPWGMKVNPLYSTNAMVNPSPAPFGDPVPEDFPKSDPYTYQDNSQLPAANDQIPRPLGMQDVLPYAPSMQAAALATRTANDGAKLAPDYGATSPELVWTADGPQRLENQFTMSITDSADAAQYGLQTASLSRGGEDGAGRAFIAPDAAGIEAGAAAMVPSSQDPTVLEPNVSTTATGAYPLPMLTYGAVIPSNLDTQACSDYGAFITYAASAGQVQGTAPGDLPPGYAPLPSQLVSTATSDVKTIADGCAASSSSSTSSSGSTTPTTVVTSPSTTVPATSSTALATPATGRSTSAPTTTVAPETSGSTSVSSAPTTTATSPPTANTSVAGLPGASVEAPPATATTTTQTAPTSTGRTGNVSLAGTRLVVPMLLVLGVIALLGARWLDVWVRRVRRPAE